MKCRDRAMADELCGSGKLESIFHLFLYTWGVGNDI